MRSVLGYGASEFDEELCVDCVRWKKRKKKRSRKKRRRRRRRRKGKW
jgi:hypothetical protein